MAYWRCCLRCCFPITPSPRRHLCDVLSQFELCVDSPSIPTSSKSLSCLSSCLRVFLRAASQRLLLTPSAWKYRAHFNLTMLRSQKSRFWSALSRLPGLRPKRQRSPSPNTRFRELFCIDPNNMDSLDELVLRQRDGFYKYSETVAVEEEPKSPAGSLILRPSASLEDDLCEQPVVSFFPCRPSPERPPRDRLHTVLTCASFFKTPPSGRHSRPYTVSSDEWVVPSNRSSSSVSQVLSLDDLDAAQQSTHMGNVLKVFTRVYAIAKIVYVVFLAYGKEVCLGVHAPPACSKKANIKAATTD